MINIDMEKDVAGNCFVSMNGHAGAGPVGQDLICCAASTIAQVLAQWVVCNHMEGKLRREPVIRLKPGEIFICFSPRPEAAEEADAIFNFVLMGFWMLRENYKKHITLNVFGEDMGHCIETDETSAKDQEGETNEVQQ